MTDTSEPAHPACGSPAGICGCGEALAHTGDGGIADERSPAIHGHDDEHINLDDIRPVETRLHARDGKQVPETEVTVEVFGQLTTPQFRHIEGLLDVRLGRHKGWSDHYVFGPMASDTADAICAYLRGIPVAHDHETLTRWTPSVERAGQQATSEPVTISVDVASKVRAYLERTGWAEWQSGGAVGTLWDNGTPVPPGSCTVGRIIEFTSFDRNTGASVGQVVRYADVGEQDNPADLLVHIRAKSGGKPWVARESALLVRGSSAQIAVPYEVYTRTPEWNGIIARLARYEGRPETDVVQSIILGEPDPRQAINSATSQDGSHDA